MANLCYYYSCRKSILAGESKGSRLRRHEERVFVKKVDYVSLPLPTDVLCAVAVEPDDCARVVVNETLKGTRRRGVLRWAQMLLSQQEAQGTAEEAKLDLLWQELRRVGQWLQEAQQEQSDWQERRRDHARTEKDG
ncbi:hypothetical protein LJC49_08360 [Ruminococcaceae bacterium OttesenSCG-928-I18]|nr:hypothetical protein [Ruminococcaceae bacterium OttesenSCG-928-I18]